MHELIEKTLKIKDGNITLFDALTTAIKILNLDEITASKIIKKNKPFMGMLTRDVNKRNMLVKNT